MTIYKLTVNLDATLAVQNQNGSFHYFKPSIGAEITTLEIDDVKVLNQKFEDLYENVIGPNFNAIVTELLVNSEEKTSVDQVDDKKSVCSCDTDESCSCKPLEIGKKLEEPIVHYDAETLLPIDTKKLPKEEWE